MAVCRLVALRTFTHNGRRTVGSTFQASAQQAALLVSRGLAKPAPAKRAATQHHAPTPADIWVCIGGGPSLTREDCEAVRSYRERGLCKVIAINSSWRLAPWADVLYGCDGKWWKKHIADVRNGFSGELWTQSTSAAERYKLRYVRSKVGVGLGRNGVIHQGGNSGYQAVNLAHLFGARTIVLLGYDMQTTGGRSHWHNDHPWRTDRAPPTERWAGRFVVLAANLEGDGVRVINASRETALVCFERATIAETFRQWT